MLELKYLKQLPCRSLNKNKDYIKLAGADLYHDADANRYAFLSFKNEYSKPFFSLYLYIKEYDSSGTFLKENKFVVPTYYGLPGIHVINHPIPVDKACDGVEVFVYFAEYGAYNFYNDQFSKAGHEVLLDLNSMKVSAKASSDSVSFIPQQQGEAKEEKVAPKEKPVGDDSALGVKKETVSYDEEEKQPQVEEVIDPSLSKVKATKRGLFNFVTIIFMVAVIIAVVVLIVLNIFDVNSFNNNYFGPYYSSFAESDFNIIENIINTIKNFR